MARLVGINHIALEVGDIDEALAFYGRLFEFELRGKRPTMAWIDAGDQFVALSTKAPLAVPSSGRAGSARASVCAASQERSPDRERSNAGGRLDHVGIVVDDKEAVRRSAQEAGLPIAAGGGLRIRDPWGNVLEIVAYRDIQFTKSPEVLSGMGLGTLVKSEDALAELRAKGLGV